MLKVPHHHRAGPISDTGYVHQKHGLARDKVMSVEHLVRGAENVALFPEKYLGPVSLKCSSTMELRGKSKVPFMVLFPRTFFCKNMSWDGGAESSYLGFE